jgi:hypothetical protein
MNAGLKRMSFASATARPGGVCALLVAAVCGLGLMGCALREKKEPDPALKAALTEPLSPEQSEEMLAQMGGNWLYGQGFGETAMNVAGVVIFPPYGLYLLGNAALSLSGYEPFSVSEVLPAEEGDAYREAFETVAAGPGRFAAAVAGEEYRTKEVIKEEYQRLVVEGSGQGGPSRTAPLKPSDQRK